MVNKHTVIVIMSIVVIASAIGYSTLNMIFVRNLEFRWHQQDSFDLLSMMFNGRFTVCNDSDYPVNFERYSIKITFDDQNLGIFLGHGAQISPHSSTTISGTFEADDKRVSQMFFSSLNTALNNNIVAARIDPSKMHVLTILETKVIGFIPFSITQEYSGHEFYDLMNQKTSCDK